MSKVISVFTPNDMKILEGILDSGSGAELQEARQTLNNTRKITPDGGYVYPVKFNPTNWFELLNTSFNAVDLLDSPEVLANQLKSLSLRRIVLSSQIEELASLVPDNAEISEKQKAVEDASKERDNAFKSLTDTYGEGIKQALSIIADIYSLYSSGIPLSMVTKVLSGTELAEDQVNSLAQNLVKKTSGDTDDSIAKKLCDAQTNMVNSSQQLADMMAELADAKTKQLIQPLLAPLNAELDKINTEIDSIKSKISLSSAFLPKQDENGNQIDTRSGQEAVAAQSVPTGFTQIYISKSASTLDKSSSSVTSAETSTGGASFLFFGAKRNSDKQESAYNSYLNSTDAKLEIGMNIAKVGIEREWFNPGVFYLTKDMFNLTTQRVAPSASFNCVDDDRLKAMSTGGGFLLFSGSKSKTSSFSASSVHSSSTDNTITLRFDTPQIIGYYLECTHADESSLIDDVSGDRDAGFVTIAEFVEAYQKILQEINSTYKKAN